MKKSLTNTLLLLIYIILILLYYSEIIISINISDVLYWLNPIYLLVLITYYFIIASKKIEKRDFVFLFGYILILFLHFILSESNLLNVVNLLSVFLLYTILPYIKIDFKLFRNTLISIFLILIVFKIPDLINSLVSSNYYDAFKGFFRNSNSLGVFTSTILFFTLLNKNKKWYSYLIIGFLFVCIIASKQRASILLLVVSLIFYMILNYRALNKKILFFSFWIVLIVVGFFMIRSEVIQGQNDQFAIMGKGGSAGRADQIFLVFQNYDINLFGYGRGVVNGFVNNDTTYSIHNTYVGSLFDYGLLLLVFFILYIYNVFSQLNSTIKKSFLFGFLTLFFFEPFMIFTDNILVNLPIISLLINLKNNNKI